LRRGLLLLKRDRGLLLPLEYGRRRAVDAHTVGVKIRSGLGLGLGLGKELVSGVRLGLVSGLEGLARHLPLFSLNLAPILSMSPSAGMPALDWALLSIAPVSLSFAPAAGWG